MKLSYLQGHISRQEAVSMIPPLLLDVHSDSRVSIRHGSCIL